MNVTGTSDVSVRAKHDYGYCNARVRGMRSRLLKTSYLEDLMTAQDLSAIIQSLLTTEYGPYLESRLLHGRTAQQIDLALRDDMVETFQKVLGMLNDEALELVEVLLGKWDLFDVKTVVRGLHMELPSDEIAESLIALGRLSQVELDELAKQPSISAVVDTLATWKLPFAVPLREALPEYNESGDLSVLELALDKHYTQWAARMLSGRGANRRLARRFLGAQVDTIDLLTCFRLLNADISAEMVPRFYLSGGLYVDEKLYLDLARMSDVDEVYARLKTTPYGAPIEGVAMKYVERGSVSVFERALEDFLMQRAFAAGRGDPLGVGIVLSYLWSKANEVTNLRIIVKGVSVGMPIERMREELIVV